MTKDKWSELIIAANLKLSTDFNALAIKPENVEKVCEACLDFVKEIRDITEVYNMENTKK